MKRKDIYVYMGDGNTTNKYAIVPFERYEILAVDDKFGFCIIASSVGEIMRCPKIDLISVAEYRILKRNSIINDLLE